MQDRHGGVPRRTVSTCSVENSSFATKALGDTAEESARSNAGGLVPRVSSPPRS